MINFPLSLFLIPYGLVVAVFAFTAFYCVHNLVRYGATTQQSFYAIFAFLAGAVFIFFFTWSLLQNTDWGQLISINAQFGGIPTSFTQQKL